MITAKQTLGILGCCLALGLTLGACGGEDGPVLARGLDSGELKTFPSPGDVPPGYYVCPDPTCTLPPSVPCDQLGDQACELSPTCRLKTLWCSGTVSPDPSDPSQPPPPPPVEKCEYQCIPKLPLLCEELTGEQACSGRSDCEWAQGPCPMASCDQNGVCPPCPFTCRAKTPPTCAQLDEQTCSTRSDCEWEQLNCAAVCQDDGQGGCLPCKAGQCTPKNTICPAMAPQPPSCPDGKLVERYASNGCLVGWDCIKPTTTCADLQAAYKKTLDAARECNPFTMMAGKQCTAVVNDSLTCGCPAAVNAFAKNELATLKDLQAKFQAAGCDQVPTPCPMMPCRDVSNSTCSYDQATQRGICAPPAMP